MGSTFKILKTVEAAVDLSITLEQHARDIYKQAKDRVEDAGLKMLFSFLAAEEEKHLGQFRLLSDEVTGGGFQQVELVGEYGMFIEMLAAEILKPLNFNQNMAIAQCVEMALRLEKDTLLVFQEIKYLFSGRAHNVIDEICQQ